MKKQKQIPIQRIGFAGAIFASLSMLLLTFASILGIYKGAVNMMVDAHMFYSPTFFGTITGMIEAGIITYLAILLFAWIYSLLGDQK